MTSTARFTLAGLLLCSSPAVGQDSPVPDRCAELGDAHDAHWADCEPGAGDGIEGQGDVATSGSTTRNESVSAVNAGRIGASPIVLGSLDKSVIDEVIERHMSQVRHCYQRELTKTPDVEGTLVVKFLIASDGAVSSAETMMSTLDNAALETCLNQRFMRMVFPEPPGGGIVLASYPFIFRLD